MTTKPNLASEIIDLIAEMYAIESPMREVGSFGSAEHQRLRQSETRAIMARIETWPGGAARTRAFDAVQPSLLTTALAAGVEPKRWLAETSMALPTTPQSLFDTLLPLPRPVIELESMVPSALAATNKLSPNLRATPPDQYQLRSTR